MKLLQCSTPKSDTRTCSRVTDG